MARTVGIPQAMLYYKYYPMWYTFLKHLGAEVVVSDATNQQTVSRGAARVVSDTCLPVKVFFGHVLALAGKCDAVFIPVLRSSQKKIYNCSRFLGLPDVARAVIPECPEVIEIEFDMNRSRGYLYRQIFSLGRHFTSNPLAIRRAALAAWQAHRDYNRIMAAEGLDYRAALGRLDIPVNVPEPKPYEPRRNMTIGLVGHPYVLYDDQVSHRLISRLQAFGIRVLTPEMARPEQGRLGDAISGRYWESEPELIDAAEYYIKHKADGIIGMMAFSCGPDSLMMYQVQRMAQQADIPFTSLTVEEHTAEAGIITRLEAFVDMLQRRLDRVAECA